MAISRSTRSAPPGVRRVLLVEPLGSGGIAQYTHCLAEQLAQYGVDLIVATRRSHELADRATGYRRKRIFLGQYARRGPTWFKRALLIARAIANNLALMAIAFSYRPEVTHLQWPLTMGERWTLPLIRRFVGPIVFTLHNTTPHETSEAEVDRLKQVCKLAQAVITHGDSVRREAIQRFRLEPRSVRSIHHGVYEFAVPVHPPTRTNARRQLGLDGEAPVILFFGYVRPYKGLDVLLEACARVRRDLPLVKLLIVGQFEAEAFGGAFDPRRSVAKLGISDATLLDLRYLPLEQIAPYFIACDVVAVPYTRASQSGVIQLAYAFGRPVVVTNVGSLHEVVEDERSGFIVPPANVGALADRLVHALSNRPRLHEMGAYAAAMAARRFSWRSAALATLDVYAEAVQAAANN